MAEAEARLEELGNGLFAYTQLPGSWGFSNAGLVTDGEESLLVDTLFDHRITARMLEAMRRRTPAAASIGTVVNTHGNGDHCYGNAVLPDAEIIATPGAVDDLKASPPGETALFLAAGRWALRAGPVGRAAARLLRVVGVPHLSWLLEAAELGLPALESFDFAGVELTLPSRTFSGRVELAVGGRTVELVEVGPAHTRGDCFVYVPDARVLFTGDLVFKDAHPIIWHGPVSNWIAACRRMKELEIDVLVPGHGPLADAGALDETADYLELLATEARKRHAAGCTADEAVDDIVLDAYRGWLDPERAYVNIHTIYRELDSDDHIPHILEQFAGMARLRRRLGT